MSKKTLFSEKNKTQNSTYWVACYDLFYKKGENVYTYLHRQRMIPTENVRSQGDSCLRS